MNRIEPGYSFVSFYKVGVLPIHVEKIY